MTDLIILLILLLLVGGAVAYIVRAKKRGVKCIGCPAAGNCPGSRKASEKNLKGIPLFSADPGGHCAACRKKCGGEKKAGGQHDARA